MKIDVTIHSQKRGVIKGLEDARLPFWTSWRELAGYYLPRRYVWLLSPTERLNRTTKNSLIIDGTGTNSAKTLASGMMNGITSPSRPWLRLRATGFEEDDNEARIWLDEVTRRILLAMAETNFYNTMAVAYLDLSVFGTAAILIYEDYENVFRCYNCALGEYYLAQDDRQIVNTFARQFSLQVHQVVKKWGIENCSEATKSLYNMGGASCYKDVSIIHLIEPNIKHEGFIKGNFDFRELYWEVGAQAGEILSAEGFYELPGIFPRWELTANDSYGTSPAMDALGDVIQLQHESKKKAQGLDKLIDPPVLADVQLQNKPLAMLPRGVTYVAGINNVGVKAAYQVQLPLDMMTEDIREVQGRIRETFHNDLFRMISQLDTVRSATEIDARREEKLVLLGPVLERFENEALDPAVKRIYAIMDRAGLLPEPPERLQGANIEIQYVSVLTSAQTAVATIPTERWIGLIGNVAAVYPGALNVPNWEELILNYGRDLGVRAKDMKSREEIAALREKDAQLANARETAATGDVLVNSAKTLSETDVGGGSNALQQLINPYG